MNGSFFYPSMIKLITTLKDKNNNITTCIRQCKMMWSQVNKCIQLLYMYDFVDLEKRKGLNQFNLTEDGMKLRDYLCNASALIEKNRDILEQQLKPKIDKEMIEDAIKKDLL